MDKDRFVPIFTQIKSNHADFDSDRFMRIMKDQWRDGFIVTGSNYDISFLDLEEGKMIKVWNGENDLG